MKKLKFFGMSMGICYIMILILFLITATIFAHTNINDKYINIFIYITIFLSTFVSAIFLNINIKEKGLMYGGIFGIVVMSVLYLIAMLFIPGISFTINTLICLSISILSSVLGGIIGVNL